ncbi:MAG: glycosyltransferase family 1 protein [Microthrixaceae bacterium]
MNERLHRVGVLAGRARDMGPRELARRVARRAYQRLGAQELEFPLLADDVADSARLDLPVPTRRPARGAPLRIAWISEPPARGSGGHTTMFRMIQGLERAGHTCELLLYDRYGGNLDLQREVVRSAWPFVDAAVRGIGDGLDGYDACVATAWSTAHVLARRSAGIPCRRLYLAQDFEPFFYPRGDRYALAEDTYRFGFRTVTIGHMAADLIAPVAGVRPTVAEFGCDTDVYRLTGAGPRDAAVLYLNPSSERRGLRLALLAMAELHRRHPEVEIITFGDDRVDLPFPATRLGVQTPESLARIYNRAITGLALSFTNISLIAEELLACGVIPVVNDHPYARADLAHPDVRWALATPGALADALCAAIEAPDREERARGAAAGVRTGHWAPAQATLVAAVEDEVHGPPD